METKHGEVKSIYKKEQKSFTKKANGFDESSPFMSIEQVIRVTGVSKAFIYRNMGINGVPKSRKIGSRKIAFVRAEVDAWMQSIIDKG